MGHISVQSLTYNPLFSFATSLCCTPSLPVLMSTFSLLTSSFKCFLVLPYFTTKTPYLLSSRLLAVSLATHRV